MRGQTVYAGLERDTQVITWDVLARSSADHLKMVATHARHGFETAIKLAHDYSVYEVRALDAKGRRLDTFRQDHLAAPNLRVAQCPGGPALLLEMAFKHSSRGSA